MIDDPPFQIEIFALSCFNQIMLIELENIQDIGETTSIPIFPETMLNQLLDLTIERLAVLSPLLYLEGPICIIGDLHGSLHDLLRILKANGYPPETKYLFLGDYVDRGQFSLEVITLIILLYLNYPDSVAILRGNHETRDINSKYGFLDEIQKEYKSVMVWERFNQVFDCLPIAAIVNNSYFCVHGGLSQSLKSLDQIKQITYPLRDIRDGLVQDLLWSDPDDTIQLYTRSFDRGLGCHFGPLAIKNFLEQFDLRAIVRAHQYNTSGISNCYNNKCITVFSSSSYRCDGSNDAGYIIVNEKNELASHSLKFVSRSTRLNSFFFKITPPNEKIQRCKSYYLMKGSQIRKSTSYTTFNRKILVKLNSESKLQFV